VTNKPELYDDFSPINGLAALALLGVLVAVFAAADFGDPAGFPADASVTAGIGYALFNLSEAGIAGTTIPSEGFLVAFVVIAVALDVAIDGAIYLAEREEEKGFGRAVADGGRSLVGGAAPESVRDGADDDPASAAADSASEAAADDSASEPTDPSSEPDDGGER